MIVVLKGIAACHHPPLAPTSSAARSGPLLSRGESAEWHFAARAATAGRAPRSLCKKICASVEPFARCPPLKCRLPLQALGFSNLSILWGWGGRFHHATGPASAGPLSRRGPPLCRRRGARRRGSGGIREADGHR